MCLLNFLVNIQRSVFIQKKFPLQFVGILNVQDTVLGPVFLKEECGQSLPAARKLW